MSTAATRAPKVGDLIRYRGKTVKPDRIFAISPKKITFDSRFGTMSVRIADLGKTWTFADGGF